MGRNLGIFFLFSIIFSISASAQQPLRDIARSSATRMLYRIPADTAERYLSRGVSSLGGYLLRQPAAIAGPHQPFPDALPTGNYLLVWVEDTMICASYYQQSGFDLYSVDDHTTPRLTVYRKDGSLVENAVLSIRGKKLKASANNSAFWLRLKPDAEKLVRVETPGDTTFFTISAEGRHYKSLASQRRFNFRSSRFGKIINWLPGRISKLFSKMHRNTRPTKMAAGYMLFNKSLYQPGDTVKWKAFLVDKRGNPIKKSLDVVLAYRFRGEYKRRVLGSVEPAHAGSFFSEFMADDSLPPGNYNLSLLRSEKQYLNSGFSIEQYVLKEMSSYEFSALSDNYHGGDTLRFTASARDVNGLAVMDGRVRLYLLASGIKGCSGPHCFVADTLWKGEKPLKVNEETQFDIPSNLLPPASMDLKAIAEFRNSSNELHTEETTLRYEQRSTLIRVREDSGYINAVYLVNGVQQPANGWLDIDSQDTTMAIRFPFRQRIDPHMEEYSFYTKDSNGEKETENDFAINDNYQLSFIQTHHGDTSGFRLSNPKEVAVFYTLYFKQKKIFSAVSSNAIIEWEGRIPRGEMYWLSWQYYWGGSEKTGSETLALLDKILNTNIRARETVYPGQQDSIRVTVTDFKGKPASGVNLTALSYNSQVGGRKYVPDPPYLRIYRGTNVLDYGSLETDYADVNSRFPLSKNQGWKNVFHLDTMRYYRLLYPNEPVTMIKTPIAQLLPQVAVFAVQHGQPQRIILLYLDRTLRYYDSVNAGAVYAFQTNPGFVKIGFRLIDKMVEVDSIYLQPGYKHDVVIDLDHPGKNTVVTPQPTDLTGGEKELISTTVLRVFPYNIKPGAAIWQHDRTYRLANSSIQVVGPFNPADSIQFYQPGRFDLKFTLEANYIYQFDQRLVRLEKIPFFDKEKVTIISRNTSWRLGDTLSEPPTISYASQPTDPELNLHSIAEGQSLRNARVSWHNDSTLQYLIIHRGDTSQPFVVAHPYSFSTNKVPPGRCQVILVTNHFNCLIADSIEFLPNGTTFIQSFRIDTNFHQPFIDMLFAYQDSVAARARQAEAQFREQFEKTQQEEESSKMKMDVGAAGLTGQVIDEKGGSPIAGATVSLKGYKTHTVTNNEGVYVLQRLVGGDYVIVFSGIGYQRVEQKVHIKDGEMQSINKKLSFSIENLEEVVVTGYGLTRRKSLTTSYSVVRSNIFETGLQGKVSGIMVSSPGVGIQIRGISSFTGDAVPLYVVDGVVVDASVAQQLDQAMIQNMSMLSGAEATSLYGSSAANGVVLISTKANPGKEMRDQFRDYAFWVPEIITDRNGKASFQVTYPDNITSWDTYVVGMDHKKRVTKSNFVTRAFKPALVQLGFPQFLVQGDTANYIAKAINYASSAMAAKLTLDVNGKQQWAADEMVQPNSAVVKGVPIAAVGDSVKAILKMETANGFRDGEARPVPVFPKGTIEYNGIFTALPKDTVIRFVPKVGSGTTKLYARNNTLDLMLDQVDYLKRYPFACMEQTASKLRGLLMEKKIMHSLDRDFKEGKMVADLLMRLQKNQAFDGGWPWWPGGNTNVTVTNYVTRALLEMRGDSLLETNLRNALLYLQNQLRYMNTDNLVESLYTLSQAGDYMDYSNYLNKLKFDSLSVHRQWQVIRILQQQKMDYSAQLKKMFQKEIPTMTGGLHWGKENYRWADNTTATSLVAYRVLKDAGYTGKLDSLRQFFLERSGLAFQNNTVEAAGVLSTIVPDLLSNNRLFASPAMVRVTGDTNVVFTKFPAQLVMHNSVSPIAIQKTGGGLVYLTLYQETFNADPEEIANRFSIHSSFIENRTTTQKLHAGIPVEMKVDVEARQDAEYVQLTIPIPAGCTFGKKAPDNYHYEYYKDRVVIFIEKMAKGQYSFSINLEPRYSGRYNVNPVRAELMYFPVLYGRNKMENIVVEKENE